MRTSLSWIILRSSSISLRICLLEPELGRCCCWWWCKWLLVLLDALPTLLTVSMDGLLLRLAWWCGRVPAERRPPPDSDTAILAICCGRTATKRWSVREPLFKLTSYLTPFAFPKGIFALSLHEESRSRAFSHSDFTLHPTRYTQSPIAKRVYFQWTPGIRAVVIPPSGFSFFFFFVWMTREIWILRVQSSFLFGLFYFSKHFIVSQTDMAQRAHILDVAYFVLPMNSRWNSKKIFSNVETAWS